MKRKYDLQNDAELNDASWEAGKGAMVGAATWGLYAAVLGTGAYFYSPIYRNLTVQFKVFIQMSAMTLGGMVEADRRLRYHEAFMRHNNRLKRDAAVWRAYEADFEARGTPGVGSEADIRGTQKEESVKYSEEVDEAKKK
ncbi:hypothetical protein E6O75_ATG09128 [Venturia nashicola]|uniref:Uncharacterized protein n=1 Tax=Venturia nashicola TaxID=86259 RepID=A0A4Z1P5C9_9PEZI|nr:hypothetical protein E6O75_ATG09128 [Venturia nashicola]